MNNKGEKKMNNRVWIRAIALILAMLLTGCTTSQQPSEPNIPTSNTELTNTTEPSKEDKTDPAHDVSDHEHKHIVADIVAPTCISEGYTVYNCECGDSYIDDYLAMLEHTYEKTDTVAPTTENEGYTIYVCRECFQSKRDDYVPALEEEINALQRNSINMLNYLATISARINECKGNRLMLEEVYTILLNDTNPGKIDDETQDHMEDLRYIINNFIDTSVKRERLQYLYNQDKASAIRSAVPDPLSILSVSNSLDWKRLAASVVFTVVDSYNNYAAQVDSLDREYLISSWELDDEETATIRRNREDYFDYMVDIVQLYQFDGNITLNENAVTRFADICENGDLTSKVQFLESEKKTYEHFANYWLELSDCYYELGKYEDCLSCVETYQNLSVGIFRKDYDYAQLLPKIIVAAQETNKDTSVLEKFANDIIDNTDNADWALRYFAAQVYVDLYSETNQKNYLDKAYQIALDNVNELKGEQQELNKIYLADVAAVSVDEPDYSRMNEQEKKDAKAEYKAEKDRADAYNKSLKETRKTELPPLYEPLIVNCDLLFALADKLNIGSDRQLWIEDLLKTKDNGVFLSDAVNNRYSFDKQTYDNMIVCGANTIEIPANLLSQDATIEVIVKGNATSLFNDWKITKVARDADGVESFTAYYTSESIKKVEWAVGTEVTVNIYNGTGYEPLVFQFKVSEMKYQFPFGKKPVFEVL